MYTYIRVHTRVIRHGTGVEKKKTIIIMNKKKKKHNNLCERFRMDLLEVKKKSGVPLET